MACRERRSTHDGSWPGSHSLRTEGVGDRYGGASWLGRGNFNLRLGAAMKPNPEAHGTVLMSSGSWLGAGCAEKPAPVASWAKRHILPAGSLPWPLYPLGFPALCLL